MTAAARCLLYRTAIQTGLRSDELRGLTRGSFELAVVPAFVKVASGQTKNRQTAHQYLDADLVRDLVAYMATKTPQASVFTMPAETDVADMLRADLADARKLWLSEVRRDAQELAKREQSDFLKPQSDRKEVLDFHALRHTCGAWLAIQGVQAKVIQSVMRHSTITLTLDTYGHLIEGAEAAAVNQAASMTAMPEMLRATGTGGELANNVLTNVVRSGCVVGAPGCEEGTETDLLGKQKNPGKTRVKCESVRLNATSCDSTPARTRTLDPLIKSQLL